MELVLPTGAQLFTKTESYYVSRFLGEVGPGQERFS